MKVDCGPDGALETHWLAVAVPTPAHSAVAEPLTYRSAQRLPAGSLVRVPLGRREVLGIVWDAPADASPAAGELRAIASVPRVFFTPLFASFLIGASGFF